MERHFHNIWEHKIIRKRLNRWSKDGKFREAFKSLAAKVGKRDTAMIDPAVIKARRTAASMKKDKEPRKTGRSAGLDNKDTFIDEHRQKTARFYSRRRGGKRWKRGGGDNRKKFNTRKKLLADNAYDTDQIRRILKKSRRRRVSLRNLPGKIQRFTIRNYMGSEALSKLCFRD